MMDSQPTPSNVPRPIIKGILTIGLPSLHKAENRALLSQGGTLGGLGWLAIKPNIQDFLSLLKINAWRGRLCQANFQKHSKRPRLHKRPWKETRHGGVWEAEFACCFFGLGFTEIISSSCDFVLFFGIISSSCDFVWFFWVEIITRLKYQDDMTFSCLTSERIRVLLL